jgi:hypothetical protein
METILDIFVTLNSAIDAGLMTHEGLVAAVATIMQRAHDEHPGRALPLDWTLQLSREVQALNLHWEVYQAAEDNWSAKP